MRFVQADLASADWDRRAAGSPPGRFDWLTAFAVLHHVPGEELRLGLLAKVRRLLPAGGRFAHSEWQFLESDRLRARIQPWEAVGLRDSDLDPGDFLLDWRSGGRGLRYVHHFDEAELESLAAAAGFRVREAFRSDGENGRLGLYQVWERS
jgi:SAM-dependent methyltransferase